MQISKQTCRRKKILRLVENQLGQLALNTMPWSDAQFVFRLKFLQNSVFPTVQIYYSQPLGFVCFPCSLSCWLYFGYAICCSSLLFLSISLSLCPPFQATLTNVCLKGIWDLLVQLSILSSACNEEPRIFKSSKKY